MNKTEREAVLKDPDGHFPYKRKAALAAGLPEALVDASERVVKAQEAYLRDPSTEALQERNEAELNAQKVSAEQADQRRRAVIVQLIADIDAGGEGAQVDFVGNTRPDAATRRASLEQQLADLDAEGQGS